MTAVGKLNPNSTLKEYMRGLNESSPIDRHIVLADIKASLGDGDFNTWYNEIYKLRAAGKQEEYEKEISNMFGFCQVADAIHDVVTTDDPEHVRIGINSEPQKSEYESWGELVEKHQPRPMQARFLQENCPHEHETGSVNGILCRDCWRVREPENEFERRLVGAFKKHDTGYVNYKFK